MHDPTGVPEVDAFLSAASGSAPAAPARLTRDTGTGVPELDAFLSASGVTQGDPDRFKSQYQLDAARGRLKNTPLTTSQSFRRDYMPFSDLSSLNFLPDLPQFTVNGVPQTGGRVVGTNEYGRSADRFRKGAATPDDIETIARYEHLQEATEAGRKGVKEKLGFAGEVALEVGGLGKIGGEAIVGGKVLQVGGKALGIGRAAAPAANTVGAAIPAVPVVPSLGRRVVTYAGQKVPLTAVTPALYMEQAKQKNLEQGRDGSDWRGYPAAFGYGYATMLVLGQFQNGLPGGPSQLARAGNALAKGTAGVAELTGVDAAAEFADKYLPKAWQTGAKSNASKWLDSYLKGDKAVANDTLRHTAVQVVAFGLMARLHGRDPEPADNLYKRYGDAMEGLTKSGLSKGAAAKEVEKLHGRLEEGLFVNPYMTREAAREILKTENANLKPYAEKLADTFEPAGANPQLRQPPERATQDREVAAAATKPTPPPEAPPKPTAPTPPAPKPKAGPIDTKPAGGEGRAEYVARMAAIKLPEAYVERMADAYFPNGTDGKTPVVTKPPTPTTRAQELQQTADKLTAEFQAEDAKLLETRRKEVASGTSPDTARQRYKDRRKRLRERLKVDAARDELQKELANPTKGVAAAATPSEIAPEAPKTAPEVKQGNTPAEPVESQGPAGSAKTPGGLTVSEGRPGGKDFAGYELTTHDVTNAAGEKIGDVSVYVSGKTVHVNWAGGNGLAGGEGRGANPIGARELIPLVEQFAKLYPDAEVLKYTPSDGRINAGAVKWIDLVAFRKRGELKDRRAKTGDGTRRATDVPKEEVAAAATEPVVEAQKTKPKIGTNPRPKRKPKTTSGDEAPVAEPAKERESVEVEIEGLEDAGNASVLKGVDGGRAQLQSIGVREKDRGRGLGQLLVLEAAAKYGELDVVTPSESLVRAIKAAADKGLVYVSPQGTIAITKKGREALASRSVLKAEPVAAAASEPKTEPPADPRAAERERLQKLYDEMNEQDRIDAPGVGVALAELGGNVGKASKGVSRARKSDAELDAETAQMVDDAPLSEAERKAISDVLAGSSLRVIGGRAGVSKTAVGNWANRAFEKMKAEYPDKLGEYDTLDEFVKARGKERQGMVIEDVDLGERTTRSAAEEVMDRESREREEGGALFSGAPIKLTFLGGIFGKGSGVNVPAFVAKWLKSAGNLPPAAFAANVRRNSNISAHAQDVASAEKDFRKALGGTYDKLPAEQLKLLDDVLRTAAGTQAREVAAAAAGLRTTPAGKSIETAIDNMRTAVDKLSSDLVSSGAIDGPLVAGVVGNIGSYLTRQYRVFTDPAWFSKVEPEVINRFKSFLRAELKAADLNDQGNREAATDYDAVVQSLLKDGTAAENPISFLSKSKLGSKDLSILKTRKDIPPELRALWGEYQDPLINYVNSVAKMSHLLASHVFLTEVAKAGAGKFLFDKPTGEHVSELAVKGSEVMEPLNGKYTTPEIKAAFEEIFNPKEVNGFLAHYMKGVGLAKYSKTVLSPTTHVRNFLGNVGFAIANGHWRMGHMPGALAAVARDTPGGRAYYRKLIELGVVGDGVNANEFREVVNDALGRRDTGLMETGGFITDRSIVRWLKKGGKMVEKLYHAEDAVWKVYAFENEAGRYEKTGMTREAAEAKAAEVVRLTYPTYSMVPRAVKALRKNPIVGPFVSFPAEVVRTTYHTVKLALTELRDPNKEVRKIGATRLAGMAAAATASAALAATMRAVMGVDADEEMAMRELLPENAKNSRLLHLGKDGKGEYRYVDLSRTDPHSYMSDALTAMVRGKDPEESAKLAAKAVAKPFADEELVTKAVVDIARNEKSTGGDVWNPQDTTAGATRKAGEHLLGAFTPGGYSQARRLKMGLTGEVEQRSGRGYDAGDEAAALATGQRVSPLRVPQALEYKARAFAAAKTDSAKLLNEMIRAKGVVSQGELAAARDKEEAARQKAFDDFKRAIDAAEKLGMSRGDVAKLLDRVEVSAQDRADLFAGRYRPLLPAPAPTAGPERQRAIDVRKMGANPGR